MSSTYYRISFLKLQKYFSLDDLFNGDNESCIVVYWSEFISNQSQYFQIDYIISDTFTKPFFTRKWNFETMLFKRGGGESPGFFIVLLTWFILIALKSRVPFFRAYRIPRINLKCPLQHHFGTSLFLRTLKINRQSIEK